MPLRWVSWERPGMRNGMVNTGSTSLIPVRQTIYSEPSSAVQRSMSSSLAADTAAGTGARKVRIVYYDEIMNGPLIEEIALAGTAPVNTIATNIRFIESISVIEVGSDGQNMGVITLHSGLTGAGTVIGSIAATRNGTLWAHHYVPSGKTALVKAVVCGTELGKMECSLRVAKPLQPLSPRSRIGFSYWIDKFDSSIVDPLPVPITVPGPALIEATVRPESSAAGIAFAGFSYLEV